MQYSVVIHLAEEGGYWVEVPALPGCYSQGENREDALSNVRKAIALYVSALQDDGAPIPKDEEFVVRVTVAA